VKIRTSRASVALNYKEGQISASHWLVEIPDTDNDLCSLRSRLGGRLVASVLSANRVLIYRIGSLGDTVVALPCFHLIARSFPRAHRVLLSNFPVHAKAPAAAAVLGDSGLVGGYMPYTIGTRRPDELLRLAWRIRRFRPDVLVYLTPPRGERAVKRDALFFRLCGVREIVGLPTGDLAKNRYDAANRLMERESARLLRCISPLGDADDSDLHNWDLLLTDEETAKANALLARFGKRSIIACGPGTKQQAKDWGQEKWRELLKRLSAKFPDFGLVLIGAKDDRSVSDYTAAGWTAPVLNLCGEITPRESAAVIRRARLFLGPDSGPMHLAAACGVPCVIAFASVDYRGRMFPVGEIHRPIYHEVECFNCRLSVCTEKKKICINSISVEEMFQAALETINLKETVE
jgi:heptosyltransferase III